MIAEMSLLPWPAARARRGEGRADGASLLTGEVLRREMRGGEGRKRAGS